MAGGDFDVSIGGRVGGGRTTHRGELDFRRR